MTALIFVLYYNTHLRIIRIIRNTWTKFYVLNNLEYIYEMKWVRRKPPTHLGSLPSETPF